MYDAKDKLVPINVPGWHVVEKTNYEPGGKAEIIIGTAEDEINVLFEIERNAEIVNSQWINITKLDEVDFNIEERDRGNVHLHFSFVKNNRSYHERETLIVPWSNKDLEIEYETFRDKLSPGQEEEWRLKIKGNKKDKITAEMVATMYDASLDQFAVNNWNLDLYPTSGYVARSWQPKTFTDVGSRLLARNWQPQAKTEGRVYRYLNFFNWQMYEGQNVVFRGSRSNRMRKMSTEAAPPPSAPAPQMERSEAQTDASVDFMLGESDDGVANQNASGGGNADEAPDLDNIKVRTNLNETVFFFPDLMT
ncbi:MAG: hypothetical protein AB8G22_04460, partial [Saprospiraceae bacterium]